MTHAFFAGSQKFSIFAIMKRLITIIPLLITVIGSFAVNASAQSGGTFRNFYWYGDFENATDELFHYQVDGERCGWYLSCETAELILDHPKWITDRNWPNMWLGSNAEEATSALAALDSLFLQPIGTTAELLYIASDAEMEGPLVPAMATVKKHPLFPWSTIITVEFEMTPYPQKMNLVKKEIKFFLKKMPNAEQRRLEDE